MSNPTRRTLANAIRILAMDAVQKANSGHPGMPMGMADIAEVLWNNFLRHNPCNPQWQNRDRFILSNGHGSLLQYALLHLSGYDVTLKDIQQFRQLHSRTPGHPEYGFTPGVETTTGPLGQGLGHAVGMALAEKILAATFNRPDFPIIDHYTYVFAGDGCLMEGISHEVCSLAGTWQLGKLIAIWDDNGISIDGAVKNWFSENIPERFRAYGWQVIEHVDGHDAQAIQQAIQQARATQQQPTLICCQTVIAFGAPHKAGTHDAHGAPLGEAEIAATRQQLKWPYPPFEIPDAIYAVWDARAKGTELENTWQQLWQTYQQHHPALAQELQRRWQKAWPQDFLARWQIYKEELSRQTEALATRKASQLCLNILVEQLPELLGGSADLTSSNLTQAKTALPFSAQHPTGNYLYYGVREFGMSAIMCGLALHGAFIPFGGTFLTFCDYARNAVRLAALMKQRIIFVYTHDSIGLGEDGPTHQPVEHIAMLRLTPNLSVWRPCDAVETAVAWQVALQQTDRPTCLLLSRQNLPAQTHSDLELIERGGYILSDSPAALDIVLIATGSEVMLAMQTADKLRARDYAVRVVSMPSVDRFLAQPANYREQVLPADVKKVAIEAGATAIWHQFVGEYGKIVGIDRFGESAPAQDVYAAVGLTVEAIVAAAVI